MKRLSVKKAVTQLFYNLTISDNKRPEVEAALIDAFWLIHLYQFTNIEMRSAVRLIEKKMLALIPAKEGINPHVDLTDAGYRVIKRSFGDERVLKGFFPFMEDVLCETMSERLPYDYLVTHAYIKEKGDAYLNLLDPHAFGGAQS